MPNRVPTLRIDSPQPNAVVGTAPFHVTGLVTAPGMPEPVAIDSVMVQVDAQPAVRATLKHIPNKQLVEVTFSATVQITGGQDPHTVAVTVTSDAGIPVTHTVTVTAGLRFVAPAVLVDLLLRQDEAAKIGAFAAGLEGLLKTLAQKLASLPLTGEIQGANRILAGPNLLQAPGPRPMLRIGLWILDGNFPAQELVPPSQDFPLPQLTAAAAEGCFATVPLLTPPPPESETVVSPALASVLGFALSVPTTTLQTILDILLPQIVSDAASHHFDVSTATIRTNASGTVTTTISGALPANIPLTATVNETLGTEQRAGLASKMPAVVAHSTSSSVGDDLDWIVGTLIPAIGLSLLALWGLASSGVGQAGDQGTSILDGFLEELPAWIPFRNSALPAEIQPVFLFPMAVLNFDSFGTTDTGIVGSGTVDLAARDQSMVGVDLSGPDYYPNYSYGIESYYGIRLTAFEPDNDTMDWDVSGARGTNTVPIDPFFQQGGFSAGFPLPFKAGPGKYRFTLSVAGTETCASDPAKKLTGSASMVVTCNVPKGVQPEMEAGSGAAAVTATPEKG